jgi:hypothetical protein
MKEYSAPAAEQSNSGARGVWERPTVEEVDYSATEAIYGPPGTADAGLYHS